MDVLCAPSQTTPHWREIFGRMLIEAFACGIAVIAADSGEIANVVSDAGMIVGERDEDAWVSGLERLLGDERMRGELAARGLERARTVYSWPIVAHVTAEAIERMKAEGFEPAVVIETSSNNFQVWLNHGQVLDAAMSTRAAKALVERFGGDRSSADWRHFGRLAGFTNPKREGQLPSGLRPFARLRSATGRVYSKAAEFLVGIRATDDASGMHAEEPMKPGRRSGKVDVRALTEFHADPAYCGDLHRADMAWAKHAAGCGMTLEQITDELLDGRDLSKKGSRKRQPARQSNSTMINLNGADRT